MKKMNEILVNTANFKKSKFPEFTNEILTLKDKTEADDFFIKNQQK